MATAGGCQLLLLLLLLLLLQSPALLAPECPHLSQGLHAAGLELVLLRNVLQAA